MASPAVENLLLQFQPLLESRAREVEVEGVTPALLKELSAHMIDTDHGGLWESLRMDRCPICFVSRLYLAHYQDCYSRSSTVL